MLCEQFVQQEILQILYAPVLERLRAHQAAGDTTVLCSASPDWWTQLVGKALGFTHTIGTPAELGECVALMPHIPAPGNNKGANKLIRLAGIGISGMMHGYLVLDKNDRQIAPFRTWRNTITEKAADVLSEEFKFNIPQRWTVAHLYQAILNKEEHIPQVDFVTTLLKK